MDLFSGMADNDCDRLISFRDYINVNNMYIYEGAFSRIDPYHKYASSGLNPVTNPCMYEQFDWKPKYLDLYRSFVFFQPNITSTHVSLLLCKHDGCFYLTNLNINNLLKLTKRLYYFGGRNSLS